MQRPFSSNDVQEFKLLYLAQQGIRCILYKYNSQVSIIQKDYFK